MLPILTADDYAMTAEVSRGIEELAMKNRLSATSVMTNMPSWPVQAPRLRTLRGHIATGLHLNLTCGSPITQSRALAPTGKFHSLKPLLALTHTRALAFSYAAVRGEIHAQLQAFTDHAGYLPDHIDGHQHVHVLPVIREALIAEIRAAYGGTQPLVRIPRSANITAKSRTVGKLSHGLAEACRKAHIPINTAFAGFSSFDRTRPYAAEIDAELSSVNGHNGIAIVMCHPGYPDNELRQLDPLTDRRRDELDALKMLPDLPSRIWHPARTALTEPIDWQAEIAHA